MKIVSTMGSGSLGRELDLQVLVDELEKSVGEALDPSFHGSSMVTVRLEDDGPAYTIYRTGTFQIRGAGDDRRLKESASLFEDVLNSIGLSIGEFEFRQVTSVFTEELDQRIDLAQLAVVLGFENIEYEPEQFPALIYKPPEYGVTILVFANGKLVIGGTKTREVAKNAVEHLKGELTEIEND